MGVREESQSNMSNSTLRRKLFAGMIGDDETFDSEEEEEDSNERRYDMEDNNDEQNKENVNLKENCESTAMIVSPGKVIMTPTSQRIPSPNKSLSWSLSPVSRKKSPIDRGT